MYLTYLVLHEVACCMVVWCTQNAPRRQQFHVAPAMPAVSTPLRWIFKKRGIKKEEEELVTRVECVYNESARERRIALYKSDQQQHIRSLLNTDI